MQRVGGDEGSVRIECAGGRLHVRWYIADTALWEQCKEDFKSYFPRHGDRSYDSTRKCWSVPSWQRDRLEMWVHDWFSRDAQHWNDAGEPEGHTYGHDGYERATRQDTAVTTLESAYRALYLLPSAPGELVTSAYRLLAQRHHPDHGGDTALMVRLNAAMEVIRQQQERAS